MTVAVSDSAAGFTPARTVDATGRFAMPGLWDMHVHFGGGEPLIEENRNLLPLYIAHGITTVRDAAGDLSPSVLEWRAAVAAGATGHIFNLGHGVMPATDPGLLTDLVALVHSL